MLKYNKSKVQMHQNEEEDGYEEENGGTEVQRLSHDAARNGNLMARR